MKRPLGVYVVKSRDTHYLYGTGAKYFTVHQRLARRFASAFEAWNWIVANTYRPSNRTPTTHYRVVRLVPRDGEV